MAIRFLEIKKTNLKKQEGIIMPGITVGIALPGHEGSDRWRKYGEGGARRRHQKGKAMRWTNHIIPKSKPNFYKN